MGWRLTVLPIGRGFWKTGFGWQKRRVPTSRSCSFSPFFTIPSGLTKVGPRSRSTCRRLHLGTAEALVRPSGPECRLLTVRVQGIHMSGRTPTSRSRPAGMLTGSTLLESESPHTRANSARMRRNERKHQVGRWQGNSWFGAGVRRERMGNRFGAMPVQREPMRYSAASVGWSEDQRRTSEETFGRATRRGQESIAEQRTPAPSRHGLRHRGELALWVRRGSRTLP